MVPAGPPTGSIVEPLDLTGSDIPSLEQQFELGCQELFPFLLDWTRMAGSIVRFIRFQEKLEELYKLDRELQEHSFNVSSLQEDRVRKVGLLRRCEILTTFKGRKGHIKSMRGPDG